MGQPSFCIVLTHIFTLDSAGAILTHFLTTSVFFFFNRYFYLLIVGQGLFLVARGGYSVVAVHKLLNELASLGA